MSFWGGQPPVAVATARLTTDRPTRFISPMNGAIILVACLALTCGTRCDPVGSFLVVPLGLSRLQVELYSLCSQRAFNAIRSAPG